ncbi:MAG: asparaginase domain-containing protein [Treponema sp.]|jgi:aspartyl-tRNA(Asn)/glutamyl-tRNA(Gln) amidotransferase subunit B|nr:asparaginase domain-containing protein [Treponema sp.]
MYKSYIALEVRIRFPSETKAFCACEIDDNAAVSCPVCRGESGAFPLLNTLATRKAYLLIQGLHGSITREAVYERNMSMPALLDGHALSRLSVKLGVDAGIDIMFHRRKKHVRITEIRLEEDAGRLIHRTVEAPHGVSEAVMDYSSAGMPSLRISTAADFEIGEEAELFLHALRRLIQYLELLPGTQLENVIRCNAYVALANYPETPTTFVKLRNLNSFNFVTKAINMELSRQEAIVTEGGTVVPESRLWNEAKNTTESFKNKWTRDEKPHFILLEDQPFAPAKDILESLDSFFVELSDTRRNRFVETFGLPLYLAEFVCDEKSRADYFEETVALGASPKETAQWMASFVVKARKYIANGEETSLSPLRFAAILKMLATKRIHAGIAKQLITAVLEESCDPEKILRKRGWEQITDRKLIEALVKRIIEENPQEVRRIREGAAGPIQFLTGLIMRETHGLAEPMLVKDILKEQLSVSLVYVLSMGGAISGRVSDDDNLECGDEKVLRDLLAGSVDISHVCFESIFVGRLLSEEIVPSDWAALIETIVEKLNSGTANGIVVAHGTDTLPYTAPLLYWLFADASAPIVLAASSTTPAEGHEATQTMKKAVDLALSKPKGVYVVNGGKVLSPLNLKFERIGNDGFRNWNMDIPVFSGTSLLSESIEANRYVLSQLLEEAVNSICVIRIYPGLRSDYLTALMEKGVRYFFLELYDTGTAGFREGPYSLKRVFTAGKRRGTRFYCTSQQEGIVDFSGYTTSHELWREGAVPLGAYTTETAVARFLAASLIADSEEERAQLMESVSLEAGNHG